MPLARRLTVAAFFAALTFAPRAALAQPEGDCGPIDLVLCVDDTGSMGGAIANVVAEMPEIIDAAQAASGGDFRVALVTFKDNVRVRHRLDANPNDVKNTITMLTATGGNGEAEASDEALRTIVDLRTAAQGCPGSAGDFTVPFRPAALKIICLITDNPPAGCNDLFTPGVDDVVAHQIALDAASQGILIAGVRIPTGSPAAKPVMEDYAAVTGGSYLEVANSGVGTGRALTFVLDSCGGVLECVSFDFDEDFSVIPPNVNVNGNFFQTFGVRLSARSNDTGFVGLFTGRQGAPGTETDDIVPVSGNFVSTRRAAGDVTSDFGEVCVDFVDPVTFLPRPVEYAEITFLDVEDSTGTITAFSRPGCGGSVVDSASVSNRGDRSQAKASVGMIGSAGAISIGSVRIRFGDSSDSAAIDQLCFSFTPNRVGVDNDVSSSSPLEVRPGGTAELTLRMVFYRDWEFDGVFATVGILRPESPRHLVKLIETSPLHLPPRTDVFRSSQFRIPERWGIRNIGKSIAFGQLVLDDDLDYLRGDYATFLIVP